MNQWDVVTIGAGPIGLLYASWVKQKCPQLKILVLDRHAEPGHKIGESTLSGFCKALRSVGISHQAMQQLFFPKNGLGFFYGDANIADITRTPEYILETFDETFQVERRVLDGLMLANARKKGIEIIQNARVQISQCHFSAKGNTLIYRVGSEEYAINARLVVDASGPNSLLGRHFNLYADRNQTFQNNAVWGYFKNVRSLDDHSGWRAKAQFPRDEYTQHICFREGWMWYIPLISWQNSPTENLSELLEYLVTNNEVLMSRQQLSDRFHCPFEKITSIGLVLRDDRDRIAGKHGETIFEHYKRQIPAIASILEGAELLDNYYPGHNPYAFRQPIRYHCRNYAGDGWILIGDAAFFVDPLISPGLTGGAAVAYQAAQATLKALTVPTIPYSAFRDFEGYVKTLHEALERDNQLVYMSFNHPEALALIQRFQEIYARNHFNEHEALDYGLNDTNVWGILDKGYQVLQKTAWEIMRNTEIKTSAEIAIAKQQACHYEKMVKYLQDCLSPYIEEHINLTPYITQNRERQPIALK